MDCTIAMLLTCLSWANLYVDGGVSYHDAGVLEVYRFASAATVVVDGNPTFNESRETHTRNLALNPYGRIAIGYELRFRSVSWRLEAAHWSSLDTSKDRGVNGVSLNARWFPFANRASM